MQQSLGCTHATEDVFLCREMRLTVLAAVNAGWGTEVEVIDESHLVLCADCYFAQQGPCLPSCCGTSECQVSTVEIRETDDSARGEVGSVTVSCSLRV